MTPPTKEFKGDRFKKSSIQIQLALILIFTFLSALDHFSKNRSALRPLHTFFTDLKFRIRGPLPPSNQKIAIVEIDNASLVKIGRWPWPRQTLGNLVDSLYRLGAASVSLDILLPERELPIPEELQNELEKRNLLHLIKHYRTDESLRDILSEFSQTTVLGWSTESYCHLPFCLPAQLANMNTLPKDLDRFRFGMIQKPDNIDWKSSPLFFISEVTENLPLYNEVTRHQGFVNSRPDSDGAIRRYLLTFLLDKVPHPSLALETARVHLKDQLKIRLDSSAVVTELGFVKSGNLPVSPSGEFELNHRGPARSFPYYSAAEVMAASAALGSPRQLASSWEGFKGATVFVGATALGLGDTVSTPFDDTYPGVEIHATALDNLLSREMLQKSFFPLFLSLLILGGLLFFTTSHFEAIPSFLIFLTMLAVVCAVDTQILFKKNQNWDTGLLYLELVTLFAVGILLKYIQEERSKKFLRNAFNKYVSPSVVDQIVKNPEQLGLGGEKRELTVLFTDMRGFTSFSETMDPKVLTEFLNEYFTLMTGVLFEHGGTLDKFIGDAIMGFFGAPLPQTDHAIRASRAACQMVEKVEERREYFKNKYGILVQMGIGLHSGTVSVGNMGTEKSLQYTVIGDDVNLTSRLEGITKQYNIEVLTTSSTLKGLNNCGLAFREIDQVLLKGKSQSLSLIQLAPHQWNKEGLNFFQQAREFYRLQNWHEAIRMFHRAQECLGEDGPTQVLLQRCHAFLENPPPQGWNGVWAWEQK